MNDQMNEQFSSNDKFKLWKKWFWIGVVLAILNSAGGLIFGITLALEKAHRKEGLIIVAIAIAWMFVIFYVISPWITSSGLSAPRLRTR